MDQLAARQLGLVSLRQLGHLGLNRMQIGRRVTNGEFIPVRRTVYRVAGAPLSWEQMVLAAVLAAGESAVISHTTAAALWALKHSDRSIAGLHVTAAGQVRIAGTVGHRDYLPPGERTLCQGIPVTTPERTLVDLAAVLTTAQLAECVDDALRRRLIGLERLRRVVASAKIGGPRCVVPMQQVLADRPAGFRPGDSDWEQEMDRQWDRMGLPPACRQYRVVAGGRSYRIDRAIPDLKVGIEWNGYQTHGTTRSAFDHDSDRQADLTAEGWHVLGFTSKSTPERIMGAVLRVVEDRRHVQLPLAR